MKLGLSLAHEWSSQGDLYDSDAVDQVYNSYHPDKGIHFGTLVHYAKQAGYVEVGRTAPVAHAVKGSEGDVETGRVFAELNRGKFLYVYPLKKWLKWDESRWIWCEGGEALKAAIEVAGYMLNKAGENFRKDPGSEASKKLLRQAQRAHQLPQLHAMLTCAASEPGMGISNMDLLDGAPFLIGCRNGVVDLKTGALLAADPKMLITRQCTVAFDRSAKCPKWKKFLLQIFHGDQATVDYIQRALGYTLTGSVREEVFFFCYGLGRNGKSVFANVVRWIMGDYTVTAPADLLMVKQRSVPNDIAMLKGARNIPANETRADQRFDDHTLKTLVSTEPISARPLYGEYFQFLPTGKLWIRGNHKPAITDETEGAWRRVRLIPFTYQVPEDEVNPNLEDELMAEADGIFAWMVEGTLKWLAEGLKPSPLIALASAQYRDECDTLKEWMTDCCVEGPSEKVAQDEAWRSYQNWCENNGMYSGAKKTFTRRLTGRGIGSGEWIGRKRAYTGMS